LRIAVIGRLVLENGNENGGETDEKIGSEITYANAYGIGSIIILRLE
jgi:hypothetical protein